MGNNYHLLQIFFRFVMRETSCCLFLTIIKLMSMKLLTLPQDMSRYLDDLLDIGNPHFEQMTEQNQPTELQLNKAYSFDNEALF